MKNRFFFLTSYDSLSGTILSSILNQHPDIHCNTSYPDPFLAFNVAKELDELATPIEAFMDSNTSPTKLFSGNAQQYSAFELQNKSLIQKTKQPFNAANITLEPALRIQFLLYTWREASHTDDHALKYIEHAFAQISHHPLMAHYQFSYFYEIVTKEILLAKEMLSTQDKLFAIALARVLAQDTADLPVPRKKYSFEKLLESKDEMIDLVKFITNNKISITSELANDFETLQKKQLQILSERKFTQLNSQQLELIDRLIHQKLKTIYYPHITHPLAYFYAELGYDFVRSTESKIQYSKLISIQLNSNRPAQLVAYFDNIEATTDNPTEVEVLVNIDIGDTAMKNILNTEIPKRNFTIKYIETQRPKSFCDLWKPINNLLEITDPHSYFLVNISDEMLFATNGWDTILKKYIGFFPDNIFRLRASRNKFRNYFDRWECSFAQDAIPITTKKWIDIGGDWNPCFGPDSFQQLVSFYLAKEGKFSNSQYLRELPLTEIKFVGDVPALGIDSEKSWRHNNDHIKAMLICQSPKMQQEARRRAMLLKAHIFGAAEQIKNFYVQDNKSKKMLQVHDGQSQAVVKKIDYSVNSFAIFIINQWRKTAFFSYFGDGRTTKKNIFLSYLQYLKARHYAFYLYNQELKRFGGRVFRIIRSIFKIKNYHPNSLTKIRYKIKNIRNNQGLIQENKRLRELYKIVCIENQKLTDKNFEDYFISSINACAESPLKQTITSL
jgi:hypothetical protein